MAKSPKIKTKGPPAKGKGKTGKTQEPKVTPLGGQKPPKTATKTKAKGFESEDVDALSIKKELKNLRALVRGKDNDLTSITATRVFLGSAIEAVAIAEAAYRNNPHAHNSYALNGLINQARELAADLKALENVTENKVEIITSTVHTVMKRFGFQMIQQINLIKAASDTMSGKDRKRIHRMCDKAGASIAEYTNATTQSLIEELSK
jgi:hypothetical protein